ncbi:MAG: hypothetical protein J5599_06470 [Spirochaetales bacterium]|nr:hypothetical protein [Spirochaetales bacterium]
MDYLTNLILLFFIYSFVGWCIEVTLKFFQYHRFINRGFLTGPCLPIYGSGCALITAAIDGLVMISKYESSYGSVFAVSFVLCGVLEYLVSYCLEKRFHARWWDYSQKPMNLNGRVWIGNLILFGLGGVLVVKLANPLLYRLFADISFKARYITAIALSVVFITDYLISHFVLKLVKDSVEKSEADNTEAIGKEVRKMLADKSLFAKRFADAYPDVIYRTEKVKARMNAIKAETERLRQQAEARISEVQQQLSEKLEPTSQIKNSVIQNQDKLISLLYNEATADDESKQLKTEIDKDIERLRSRKVI